MVYCETVLSSSATTKKEVPVEELGKGCKYVTVDVETGNGADELDVFPFCRFSCTMRTEDEASSTCIEAEFEDARTVMAEGGGVLEGRENVLATKEAFDSRWWITEADAKNTPCSPDHDAVTFVGSFHFRTTPWEGE